MSGELVTIATYRFVPKAEMAQAFLEQAGIRAFVADAHAGNADWFLGDDFGFAKLQVSASQAAAALELFRANPGLLDAARPKTDDLDGPAKCLACGAELPVDSDRCTACGWSYDDDGTEDDE